MSIGKRIVSGSAAAAMALAGTAVPTAGAFAPLAQGAAVIAGAEGLVSVNASASDVSDGQQLVYDTLRERVQEVAAGELDSTVFTVTMADLGLENRWFTAEELGVDYIVSGSSISSEAAQAMRDKATFDAGKILLQLQADLPYELFWFDKTVGISTYTSTPIQAKYDYSTRDYLLTMTGEIRYTFAVSSDYGRGEHTVDHDQVLRAQAAAANADKIVAKYANVSDREKLNGYRKEICDLVTYNTAAAGGGAAYGDPWQMVYVFDGDKNTNVVCEGYSKAFKYLCDHTEFTSKRISCILATGLMSSRTGSGNHMWNIVKMPDGNNYMADVTNCDSGSVGADTKLFLVPYTSGSVDTGYSYNLGYSTINYYYDEGTKSIFSSDLLDLTISSHPAEPEVIPFSATPGDGSVKLDWTAVEGAENYAVCGYSGGKWQMLAMTSGTTYTLSGLKAGSSYKVAVIGKFNGEWNLDFSEAADVKPDDAVKYPKITSVDYNEKYHQFRLNWSAVKGAQNYGIAVYLAGRWKVQNSSIPAGTTSFTSPKLTPGKSYKLAVAAKVNGEWSVAEAIKHAVTVTVK